MRGPRGREDSVASIHRSRKSGFTLRSGGMRRETLWIPAPAADTTLGAASTAAIIGSFSAAALALRPFTIVRTRGFLHIRSDQTAATENWGASYGLAVVSDQAVAIGVTAVPTPETDKGSDLWFVYESIYGQFTLGSQVAFTEVGYFKDFDSRAMRKVEDGQDLIIAIETPSISGSARVMDTLRMLIKLH